MDYAIRIARSNRDISGVYDMYKGVCEVLVVYEHPNNSREGEHLHMIMIGSTKGSDTLKNYLKKLYGEFRAQDWSFKTTFKRDGEVLPVSKKFISYMSKGKYDPVYMYGVSADEISVYKAQGYDKNAIRLEGGKLIKPIKEVVKKTKRELIELMVANIDPDATITDVVKGVRQVLVKHNEVIGSYKVLEYVDAFMMYGSEQRWLSNMVFMYEKRFNR